MPVKNITVGLFIYFFPFSNILCSKLDFQIRFIVINWTYDWVLEWISWVPFTIHAGFQLHTHSHTHTHTHTQIDVLLRAGKLNLSSVHRFPP